MCVCVCFSVGIYEIVPSKIVQVHVVIIISEQVELPIKFTKVMQIPGNVMEESSQVTSLKIHEPQFHQILNSPTD